LPGAESNGARILLLEDQTEKDSGVDGHYRSCETIERAAGDLFVDQLLVPIYHRCGYTMTDDEDGDVDDEGLDFDF
jgi:hypothetical protein